MEKDWRRKNKELISRIREFWMEYKEGHKSNFAKNKYNATQKMYASAGRKFRREIDSQVKVLLQLK